jgi:uncharacterized damage-inducible protein DinB
MLTAARRALDRVLDVHGGDPWHGSSTAHLLEGLTARQASARPGPGIHSVWEIVLHMTAWTREVTSRLEGAEAKSPADGDWPAVGATTRTRWREATDALEAAQAALARAAEDAPNARWTTRVNQARDRPIGTGVTCLDTLEGLGLHHAYHGGQIGMLKRWLKAR